MRILYLSMMVVVLLAFGCERAAHHGGHGEHAMPKDWKFTLAKGDAESGKKLFAEFECYKCHEVKGEHFPALEPGQKYLGPELSQMAGAHTVEFFAEAIANPNAVIDAEAKELGQVDAAGRSRMPDFTEVMTVKQLADLAAYLASLRGDGGHRH
jgi:mono/diheme cytochrome c family protein